MKYEDLLKFRDENGVRELAAELGVGLDLVTDVMHWIDEAERHVSRSVELVEELINNAAS